MDFLRAASAMHSVIVLQVSLIGRAVLLSDFTNKHLYATMTSRDGALWQLIGAIRLLCVRSNSFLENQTPGPWSSGQAILHLGL